MPAVRPGDQVELGDPLLVLESMKMEVTVAAPVAGRVRTVDTAANVQVLAGAPLVTLEPAESAVLSGGATGAHKIDGVHYGAFLARLLGQLPGSFAVEILVDRALADLGALGDIGDARRSVAFFGKDRGGVRPGAC